MSALFLTIGCDEHYGGMVRDHEARHRAYCARWKLDYLAENPDDAIMDTFGRLDFILKHLKSGRYTYVFWIDADCIVADFDHDLRETLPDWAWLGLNLAPQGCLANIVHYQTGNMFWRSCAKSIEFIETVLSVRNDPLVPYSAGMRGWNDQEIMNLFLTHEPHWQQGFVSLSWRWNQTQSTGTEIIAAWHGNGRPPVRRRLMQEYANTHPWSDQLRYRVGQNEYLIEQHRPSRNVVGQRGEPSELPPIEALAALDAMEREPNIFRMVIDLQSGKSLTVRRWPLGKAS